MIRIYDIRKLYLEDKLTIKEVAEKLSVSQGYLRKMMKEMSIPVRSRSEYVSLCIKQGKLRRDGENQKKLESVGK